MSRPGPLRDGAPPNGGAAALRDGRSCRMLIARDGMPPPLLSPPPRDGGPPRIDAPPNGGALKPGPPLLRAGGGALFMLALGVLLVGDGAPSNGGEADGARPALPPNGGDADGARPGLPPNGGALLLLLLLLLLFMLGGGAARDGAPPNGGATVGVGAGCGEERRGESGGGAPAPPGGPR